MRPAAMLALLVLLFGCRSQGEPKETGRAEAKAAAKPEPEEPRPQEPAAQPVPPQAPPALPEPEPKPPESKEPEKQAPKGRDRARLRAAVVVPRVALDFGVSLTSDELARPSQFLRPEEEAPSLEEALRKDPGDDEKRLRLAQLREKAGDAAASATGFAECVRRLRARTEAEPGGARFLRLLGEACSGAGKWEEAEKAFRRATALPSADWEAWTDLGWNLHSGMTAVLDPQGPPDEGMDALMAHLAQRAAPPTGEEAEKVRELLREAAAAMDRAVALAPRDPGPLFARALERFFSVFIRGFLGMDEEGAVPLFKECAADMKAGSALRPGDPKLLVMSVLFEVLRSKIAAHDVAGLSWDGPGPLANASGETIAFVDGAAHRLEVLAASPDPKTAGSALPGLGFLHLMKGDMRAAEADIRRALAVRPDDDSSGELLLGILAKAERYEEVMKACKDRLARTDTAKLRLVLSRALDHLGKTEEALAEASRAAVLDPKGLGSNLTVAALALKCNDTEWARERARAALMDAAAALGTASAEDRRAYAVDRAIWFALSGDIDAARNALRELLSEEDFKEAAEALEALGR